MQFNSTHFSESVWIGLDDDWESVPEKFRSHITEQQKAILFHHNQEFQQRADDCKLPGMMQRFQSMAITGIVANRLQVFRFTNRHPVV